jgi:hypothetical protein
MLGAGADRFMNNQMTERVTAYPSNSASSSLSLPDRERAGAPHVMMRLGQRPGPQSQVSSNYMPGVQPMPNLPTPPSASLPGMSGGGLPGMSGGGLPGMSGGGLPGMSGGWIPGLGALSMTTGTLVGLAALAGGVYWFMNRKKAR